MLGRIFLDNFSYGVVRFLGFVIRAIPVEWGLQFGRGIGLLAYYFDIKHRTISYGNLKIAFAQTKTPRALRKITKQLFQNYGQNFVELLRMPLLGKEKIREYVTIEGREHIEHALSENKGVIFLAMHFGSWELASLSCATFNRPYKVVTKPQKRYSKLDDLLNTYREYGGNLVLTKGMGTRDMIRSLQNNEIIGLVVDQGGRDGELIPFFGRPASMSVGAIRLGLKLGIPICFSVIIREKGPYHRMIIHPRLVLENTGDAQQDVVANLNKIMPVLEDYIRRYPEQYTWFYKIWKYSNEADVLILDDGKIGHLRQSQAVANTVVKALRERGKKANVKIIKVEYRTPLAARLMSVFSLIANSFFSQGRLGFLKWFLTPKSFQDVMAMKPDFIISCGSSTAGINYLLSIDQEAKSVAILKPGLFAFNRFDLVVLPQHDARHFKNTNGQVVVTKGAPNLMDQEYLKEQTELILKRYSHLKFTQRIKIGLLLGGDTKDYVLNERLIKIVVNQIKEICQQLNAEILATTSRRTSERVENLLQRELKKHPACQLLIIANKQDVPEAMGGILGLSDIVVVSGDSISMVSEAASTGKKTIVFPPIKAGSQLDNHKHQRFVEQLNSQGYIVATDAMHLGRTIYDVAKNKIQTNKLDDHKVLFEAVKYLI